MTTEQIQTLIREASNMLAKAYVPYSHYHVGAALMTKDGKIYTGCNIENAAYTPSNCAERTAFFKAVSEGECEFCAIAVIGGANGQPVDLVYPCGVCRQVMMEFCDPETFHVIVAQDIDTYQVHLLKDILPNGFGPANLS